MSVAVIRQVMTDAVTALAPNDHAGDLFRAHDSSVPFIDFCERNPQLRRFYIRGDGSFEIETSTADKEWGWTNIQYACCYPLDFHAGDEMGNDRDDLIESDMRQVQYTIATNYATLETAVAGCVTESNATREDGEACTYGVLTMRVGYWRAVS